MNQDVRINVDFFSHHKTLRLKRRLGHEGIVSLLSLFCYTGKSRADGTLQGMDAEDIAAASGWAGEPQEYVETLCEIGFLERCEEGVYSVHDWQDHNPWASNANDRSDSARLSKLAQVNPEKAKEYREAGRSGITAKEYSLSAKQRNASERSANAVRNAGETLAPSPSPSPSPSPKASSSQESDGVEQQKPAKQQKEDRPSACPPEKWEAYLSFSRKFHQQRHQALGNRAPFTEKKVLDGAKTLDVMCRVRGIDSKEIQAALCWAIEDSFWNEQVRALGSLLKIGSNGDTKYANILTAMAKDLVKK